MTGIDARKFLIDCSFCFALPPIGGDDLRGKKYKKSIVFAKEEKRNRKRMFEKMEEYFCNCQYCYI